jgi:hypothetical protein
MTLPASTHVGRLYVESRHLPATRGGGGDIHDAMATPFGVRLLVGDVMGTGPAANRTGLSVLNAWRELAFTEPSLAGIAVRLHSLIARSEHPERFVTALLVNFPVPDERPGTGEAGQAGEVGGSWAEFVCCGHPPPLLLRGGSAAFIEPYTAPPLGLLDLADGWCRASMIPVGDGDQLLLYTDGVSEARDAAGRFFPLAQVTAEALAGQEAPGPGGGDGADRTHLLDALVTSLDDHVGDRACDDILMLLVTLRLPAGHLASIFWPRQLARFRLRQLARPAGLLRSACPSAMATASPSAGPTASLVTVIAGQTAGARAGMKLFRGKARREEAGHGGHTTARAHLMAGAQATSPGNRRPALARPFRQRPRPG